MICLAAVGNSTAQCVNTLLKTLGVLAAELSFAFEGSLVHVAAVRSRVEVRIRFNGGWHQRVQIRQPLSAEAAPWASMFAGRTS